MGKTKVSERFEPDSSVNFDETLLKTTMAPNSDLKEPSGKVPRRSQQLLVTGLGWRLHQ